MYFLCLISHVNYKLYWSILHLWKLWYQETFYNCLLLLEIIIPTLNRGIINFCSNKQPETRFKSYTVWPKVWPSFEEEVQVTSKNMVELWSWRGMVEEAQEWKTLTTITYMLKKIGVAEELEQWSRWILVATHLFQIPTLSFGHFSVQHVSL